MINPDPTMKRFFLAAFLFLILPTALFSAPSTLETLLLSGSNQEYDISSSAIYYKNIESVAKKKYLFIPDAAEKPIPLANHKLAYQKKASTHLFSFNVLNKSSVQKWYLTIDFYPLHDIMVYVTDSDSNIIETHHGGSLKKLPFGVHYKVGHSFALNLRPDSAYLVFVEVKTTSFLLFPAKIQSAEMLMRKNTTKYFFILMMLGVILAAFILNLILYFTTYEKSYLLLLALIILLVLTSHYQYGFGFELFPGMSDFLNIRMRNLMQVLVSVCLNLYAISYFNLADKKRIFRTFRFMNGALVLYGILIMLPWLPYHSLNQISPYFLLMVVALNGYAAFSELSWKPKLASLFLIGISALGVSAGAFALILLQIVEFNTFLYHSNYLGSAMFCLILTLGMQSKISALKENAQKAKALQSLNNQLMFEIEERKKTEGELMLNQALLEAEQHQSRWLIAAMESTASTIVVTDLQGIIQYVNPAFTEVSGYTYQEAIGHKPSLLKSDHHPEPFYRDLWETILAGHTWKGEFLNRKKNQEFYWESAVITPVFDPETGQIAQFIAVKDDITGVKKSRTELEESEIRLKELVETKDKLFSIIGHDLMNPFNALLGFSQILAENLEKEKDIVNLEYAVIISESTKKALLMLQNLLVWSGKHSGKILFSPIPTNLNQLVANEIAQIQPSAHKKGIPIELHSPKDAEALLDPQMASTILRNLLWNALKFTGEGGGVSVTIRKEADHWHFAIRDNGVGISPSHIEHLFSISSKLRESRSKKELGTGLGLIICKEFVELHGGRIWVESTEGEGSTFFFTIPA
jgi:PAS domain S-box-containing protein